MVFYIISLLLLLSSDLYSSDYSTNINAIQSQIESCDEESNDSDSSSSDESYVSSDSEDESEILDAARGAHFRKELSDFYKDLKSWYYEELKKEAEQASKSNSDTKS